MRMIDYDSNKELSFTAHYTVEGYLMKRYKEELKQIETERAHRESGEICGNWSVSLLHNLLSCLVCHVTWWLGRAVLLVKVNMTYLAGILHNFLQRNDH